MPDLQNPVPRFSELFQGVIPPESISEIDSKGAAQRIFTNGTATKFLGNGDSMLRSADTLEMSERIRENLRLLLNACHLYPECGRVIMPEKGKLKPARAVDIEKIQNHFLLKHLKSGQTTSLIEEVDYWDIKADTELDPKAAQSIIQAHEDFVGLPEDAHKLFSLLIKGRLLGDLTRKGIYTALLAQKLNETKGEIVINPCIAAEGGFYLDIGKNQEGILALVKHPGKLTREERKFMEKHPVLGAMALDQLRDGQHTNFTRGEYKLIHDATLGHHVSLKKESYPDLIKVRSLDDIPLIARMASIADSFNSMTSHRSYRANMSTQEAFEELRRCSDQFDPYLVSLFIEINPRPVFHPINN